MGTLDLSAKVWNRDFRLLAPSRPQLKNDGSFAGLKHPWFGLGLFLPSLRPKM
jgi:hypothetical protein